MNKQNENKVKM